MSSCQKSKKSRGVKLQTRTTITDAPRGVAGRNSDNTFIKRVLGWEPSTSLETGLQHTYTWIKEQYHARKHGNQAVE